MKVLAPTSLAGVPLRNAIAVSPMSRMQANEDGTPCFDMREYYARYARLGAGLIFTEALYVDDFASKAYFNQPGLANEEQAAGWRAIVHDVHAVGGRIFAQLQHGGRLAEPGLNLHHLSSTDGAANGNTWQTNSPNGRARAASMDEIIQIVSAFSAAAKRAVSAGFDGVEIHGARGYFIDDFLSASTNTRSDIYGGSLDNRLRFPCEVLAAVRAATGDVPISFNLSTYKMDDIFYQPPGGAAEVAHITRSLRNAGADVIHVSTRRVLAVEAWGESLAKTVRLADSEGGLIANGGVKTLEDAEAALAVSGATVVAIARAYLANPDWITRAQQTLPMAKYSPGFERRPLLQEIKD